MEHGHGHLRTSVKSKMSPGVIPRPPLTGDDDGEREKRGGTGWEGIGEEGSGGERKKGRRGCHGPYQVWEEIDANV